MLQTAVGTESRSPAVPTSGHRGTGPRLGSAATFSSAAVSRGASEVIHQAQVGGAARTSTVAGNEPSASRTPNRGARPACGDVR